MTSVDIIVDIIHESVLWRSIVDAEAVIRRSIEAAISVARIPLLPGTELSVVLADNAEIQKLNQRWRKKDKPTNVLSFPARSSGDVASPPLLGDIIFAYETLTMEADDLGMPIGHHLAHLTVHGFLHLFGYDHQEESDAKKMEALEVSILKHLGIANPYSSKLPVQAVD